MLWHSLEAPQHLNEVLLMSTYNICFCRYISCITWAMQKCVFREYADTKQGSECTSTAYLCSLIRAYISFHWFFFFFFFFFDLGFMAFSRIFLLYWANHSSKVVENRRTLGKTTWPSLSRTWLSHMWPKRSSNHSGEKPNGLRVNSPIHQATGARSPFIDFSLLQKGTHSLLGEQRQFFNLSWAWKCSLQHHSQMNRSCFSINGLFGLIMQPSAP